MTTYQIHTAAGAHGPAFAYMTEAVLYAFDCGLAGWTVELVSAKGAAS